MTHRLPTVRKISGLRRRIAAWRKAGERVALVPTMGYLHKGHLSLVRLAHRKADRIVVSIFVNPSQFGPDEDFERYPRDEAGDRAALTGARADLIFAPDQAEMYGDGFATQVRVEGLTDVLCGVARPHHFGGVTTVVAKLLLQTLPDVAVFGQKDYQQLLIIQRMARDLDIPSEIVGAPIVREDDGLALSSRNAYLSESERMAAPLLQRTLVDLAHDISQGRKLGQALKAGRARLKRGGFGIDYVEARNAETLLPVDAVSNEPIRLFAAAYLGKTRLIDNVAVPARSKPKRA